MSNWIAIAVVILTLLVSCKPDQPKLLNAISPEKSGILFRNDLSESEEFNIVDYLYYYNGGGVAVGDINNDGLIDVYLSANEGPNRLYLNKGKMEFEDITLNAGVLSLGAWKTGVTMADVNGDGFLDIYQCRLGNYKGISGANQLYINNGDLTFTESAHSYNLDFSGFGTQAGFFDMENDGDLDVYLLNHSVHTPRSYGRVELRFNVDSLAGDVLMENQNGVFVDISQQAGIFQSQIGYGLGLGFSDINLDGYTDIFVSNDFSENDYLYLNNGDKTFKESLSDMTTHVSRFSMGNDLADFNNDGLVDIMTLDMLPSNEAIRKSSAGDDPYEIFKMKLSFGYMNQYSRNTLLLNRGTDRFSDVAMLAGVHATDWSWGPLFVDMDNDGKKDLFISNGIKKRPNDLDYIDFISAENIQRDPNISDREFTRKMPEGSVSNVVYRNAGDLEFQDETGSWIQDVPTISNGVAYGDFDNDGDQDFIVNNIDNESFLYENTNSDSLNFLNIELRGVGKNKWAIGTRVEVFQSGTKQISELYPTRGFQSSMDPRIHFGVSSKSRIDSVEIYWPGNSDTTLYNIDPGQFLVVSQEDDLTLKSSLLDESVPFLIKRDARDFGINFTHKENPFNGFNREPLMIHMTSSEGPAMAVGDVNGDNLDDVYFGGAKYQKAELYVQDAGKSFQVLESLVFEEDKLKEDVAAQFFDSDGDGDQDLIVVSGGNEFEGESENLQPRLYLNNGKGEFKLNQGAFEGVFLNGSCLVIFDSNEDGLDDIFFGAATVPWNYGLAPKSYLLINKGNGTFEDSSFILPNEGVLGMVNDAKAGNLDADPELEIILVGEWMDHVILDWDEEEYRIRKIDKSSGFWSSCELDDFDGDGDLDIIVTNLGLNSKFKADKNNPLKLYLGDLDENGRLDQILTSNISGIESIFPTKSEISKQLVSLKKQYQSYESYAEADVNEIISFFDIPPSDTLEIVELRSGVFLNNEGVYSFHPFANELQVSYLQDLLFTQSDSSSNMILAAGNFFTSSVQEGRYSSDLGSILLETETGWRYLDQKSSGLDISGEVRNIEQIEINNDKFFIFSRNNDSPELYQIVKQKR